MSVYCVFLFLYRRKRASLPLTIPTFHLSVFFVVSVCLYRYVSSTYRTFALVHYVVSEPSDVWVGGAGWVAGVHPSTGQSWWPASVVREDIYKETLAIVAL